MHGDGRYEWPDGSSFEGQYNMNLKDGEGTFVSKFGQRLISKWVLGKPFSTEEIMNVFFIGMPHAISSNVATTCPSSKAVARSSVAFSSTDDCHSRAGMNL